MIGDNIQEIEFEGASEVNDNTLTFCNIYPNPTRSCVNVSSSSNIAEVRIIDINGTVLLQKAYRDCKETSLDISELSSGIYMLQVITERDCNLRQIIKL